MDQSILKLNDDCLLEIFSYFDLLQITRLRFVCKRFNEIADNAYRYCRTLDCVELLRRKMSLGKLEELAARIGPFCHTLKIEYKPLTLPIHYNYLINDYSSESSGEEVEFEWVPPYRSPKSDSSDSSSSEDSGSDEEMEEETTDDDEAEARAEIKELEVKVRDSEAEARKARKEASKAKRKIKKIEAKIEEAKIIKKNNERKRRFITIFESCVKLKHLHFVGDISKVFVEEPQREFLRRTLINLKTLCFEKIEVNDDIGLFLRNAKYLESLSLKSDILGTWFTQLRNLKELNVEGAFTLEPNSFEIFCRNNLTLEKLSITSFYYDSYVINVAAQRLPNVRHLKVVDDDFRHHYVVLNFQKLTHLTITLPGLSSNACYLLNSLASMHQLEYLDIYLKNKYPFKNILNAVAKFQTLKVLKIRLCPNLDDEFLKKLGRSSILEEIHLPGTNVTDDGVFNLLRNCRRLRFIDLTNCQFISPALIPKNPKNLQAYGHNPPLIILAGGTKITTGLQLHLPNLKIVA